MRRPIESKPYILVPVPEEGPRRITVEEKPHDRFSGYSGRFQLTLEVVSEYLFVGSGEYDFDEGKEEVWHKFFRKGGIPAIPGTSIKGAVRSVAETISNSCLSHVERKALKEIKKDHKACGSDSLCPACRIFGSAGYKGRVSFFDATPLGDLKLEKVRIGELWSPHIEVTGVSSRKFYKVGHFEKPKGSSNIRIVEAASKGSKFKGTVLFQSLNKSELGLLLMAMGIDRNHPLKIKLGGAKPRCFGAVKFEIKRIDGFIDYGRLGSMDELVEAFLAPSALESNGLSAFLEDCLSSRELIHERSLTSLKNMLEEGKCPEGPY